MRCHSVFEHHSSCAFFQDRCVATESTVKFAPLARAWRRSGSFPRKPMIWIEFRYILFLLFRPFYLRHPKASGDHSQSKRRLFGRGTSKSSTRFQKISWEETEKQTARSCRAWEFSRSRAQGKEWRKRKDLPNQEGERRG